MGLYLNPNNIDFIQQINSNIYVDKTLFIKETNDRINKDNRLMAISRPRRFGKTYIADMLVAYYSKGSNSKELFDNYNIVKEESYLENLNQYNVVRLDIGGMYSICSDKSNFFNNLSEKLIDEFTFEFPNVNFTKANGLADYISTVYRETNEQFIVIFDEYDAIFRDIETTAQIKKQYLDFLNGMFKEKATLSAIALAYITGIFPIVKEDSESKLNNFKESTMLYPNDLGKYIGFTEEEVKDLCDKYNVSFDEIKSWYDGYTLDGCSMYNSNSIVRVMMNSNHEICDYWGGTASFETLKKYITSNRFPGIYDDVTEMLVGNKVKVDPTSFENNIEKINTKDEVYTYLVHLGYLAFDKNPNTCIGKEKLKGKCRIPNYEVKIKWDNAIETSTNIEYKFIRDIYIDGNTLYDDVLALKSDILVKAIHSAHLIFRNSKKFASEDILKTAGIIAFYQSNQMIIGNKYITDRYIVIPECPAGEGLVDLVIIPKREEDLPIIIEFKVNKSVDDAINQIKNNNYMACLEGYNKILLVGINFNSETDKVIDKYTCKIEEYNR